MSPWIPLLTGLCGAVIGSSATIGAMIVQQYFENKRVLKQSAISIGLEHAKLAFEAAKLIPGTTVFPPQTYVYYQLEFMKLVEEDGVTPEALIELNENFVKLAKTMEP